MSQIGEQFDKLTISDYRKWRELNLFDGVAVGYHNYFLKLLQVSGELKNQTDPSLFLVCQFIAGISSLVLTERIDCPLIPNYQSKTVRFFSMEDLTGANLQFLDDIISETDNILLKARFADILWIKNHAFEKALIAIDSYLKVPVYSEDCESEHDDIWKRAITLCKQLGKNETAIRYLSDIKDRTLKAFFEGENIDTTSLLDYTDILLKLRLDDDEKERIRKKLNDYAESLVSQHEYTNVYFFFEKMLSLSKRYDTNAINSIYKRVAEVFCSEAEDTKEPLISGNLYNLAIKTYWRIPKPYRTQWGIEDKIDTLRKKMRNSNVDSMLRMTTISSESIDLTDRIANVEKAMTGKDKRTALNNLCQLSQTTYRQIKTIVLDAIRRYPINNLFDSQKLDDDGRVIARRKGFSINDLETESAQKSLNDLVSEFFMASCRQDALACILPGLRVFNREHRITEKELFHLCYYSNAVPPNRAELWAKGLYFGFQEDFITATHLLVPQVEHMVRFALQTIGEKTTSLGDDGIENETGLSSLLKHEKITMVIDEDFLPELRALMTEAFGTNMRNRLAHGLLDDRYVDSLDTVYLWWVCLRLALLSNRNYLEWSIKQKNTQEHQG